MTGRPTDWAPLAGADPLPGAPEEIEVDAEALGALADELAAHADAVAAISPAGLWVGLAAEHFDALRAGALPRVAAAGARAAGGRTALWDWAGALADAQQAGDAALAVAVAAEADRVQAVAGVAERAAFEAAAPAAVPGGPDVVPVPWSGPDWTRLRDEAVAEIDAARARLDAATAARDDAASATAAVLSEVGADALDDPAWTGGWLGGWLGRAFGSLLGSGVALGGATLQFVVTDGGLVLNTPASWRHQTYLEAGIDPSTWDPSRGLAPNDANARAAWEFYRTLYESDPERYEWAGLAWLAGATVYAGVQDLSVVRDAIAAGGDVAELLATIYPPPVVDELLIRLGTDELVTELTAIEATLMDMQRDIFDDIAWQHVAYRDGGLAAMDGLIDQGAIDPRYGQVWGLIDAGGPGAVAQANRDLAFLEQNVVIGPPYDEMREGSLVGWGTTMAMSLVAESPVDGGRAFRDVVPFTVGGHVTVDTPDRIPIVPGWLVPDRIPGTGIDVPGGDGFHVDTRDQVTVGGTVDLPLHNVSIFENRWQWITDNMLPAYRRFLDRDGFDGYEGRTLAEVARDRRVVDDDLLPYDP